MQSLAAIDPFYAACLSLAASSVQAEPSKPIYARLPLAPVTASPVPHLTSLYHFHRAGDYGDRKWPAIAAAISSKTCCSTSNRAW